VFIRDTTRCGASRQPPPRPIWFCRPAVRAEGMRETPLAPEVAAEACLVAPHAHVVHRRHRNVVLHNISYEPRSLVQRRSLVSKQSHCYHLALIKTRSLRAPVTPVSVPPTSQVQQVRSRRSASEVALFLSPPSHECPRSRRKRQPCPRRTATRAPATIAATPMLMPKCR